MKITTGLAYVFPDLLAQSLHGGELQFIPQAMKKSKFNLTFRRKFDRMEIEYMCLDGK